MSNTSIFDMKPEEQNKLVQKGMTYNTTDSGNSGRFIDDHKNHVRHIKEYKKWIIWNNGRWELAGNRILDLGKSTVKIIYDEARDCPNDTGQAELTRWAKSSQSRQRIESMLTLASGSLEVSINDFDNNHELINCRNGVLNLNTGELSQHNPEQMFMKRAEASYKPNLKSTKWTKFLNEIFLNDQELIRYVKRAIGYSLTGQTKLHKLFVAYGGGSNGKTTLLETVLKIMGDYGRVTQFDAFLEERTDTRSKEAVGMLKGARFALASETKSSKKWNEALVKRLTGGDSLTGAKMYGDSYEFEPTHKLWFMANHLPGVKDASEGFWRRPVIIPFKARFEGRSKVEGLKEDFLAKDRDAIFTWMVEGAQEYLRHGIGELPVVCKDAIDKYRSDNDLLSRFIDDKLVKDTNSFMYVKETFELYQAWCAANLLRDDIQFKYFSENMEERGIDRGGRRAGGEIFKNVRKKGPACLEPSNDNEVDTPKPRIRLTTFM